MSVEQAKAFIERMKTDEAFRAKVMAIEDGEGRIDCINSEGFECTLQEIKDITATQEIRVQGGAVHGATAVNYYTNGGERAYNLQVKMGYAPPGPPPTPPPGCQG